MPALPGSRRARVNAAVATGAQQQSTTETRRRGQLNVGRASASLWFNYPVANAPRTVYWKTCSTGTTVTCAAVTGTLYFSINLSSAVMSSGFGELYLIGEGVPLTMASRNP